MKSGSDWLSERMIFGLLLIVGYFGVVILTIEAPLTAKPANLPSVQAAMGNAKDALLVLGPLLGVIVTSIWKTDKTDKANADTMTHLAAAASTALAAPPGSAQLNPSTDGAPAIGGQTSRFP